MTRLANPSKPVEQGRSGADVNTGVRVVAEPTKPRIVYVTKNSVKVNYKKPALETKQDVEDYLAALKNAFFRVIDEDKKISL